MLIVSAATKYSKCRGDKHMLNYYEKIINTRYINQILYIIKDSAETGYHLLLILTTGKTIPIIIANCTEVFQSTIAPFLSINKFHSNVTNAVEMNAIKNTSTAFNINCFIIIRYYLSNNLFLKNCKFKIHLYDTVQKN